MKCFILTWLNSASCQVVLDALDKIPQIINWRASTGAIFLVSSIDASALTDLIHEKLPKEHFVISQISIDTVEGYTDRDTWNFIRRPRRAGEPY